MAKNNWSEKGCECLKKEDFVQAKTYFEKAAEEGDVEAYCFLGDLYYLGDGVEQDYEKAFDIYMKGYKAGDTDCATNLGTCYYWGLGVEADLHKAAFYKEKAAEAGDSEAMFDLGLCYEKGYGVSMDIRKAIDLFKKASEEVPFAYLKLASIYEYGEGGIEKDLAKAFEYSYKAMIEGEKRAGLILAPFYEKGIVVEKDTEKAKTIYQETFDYLHKMAFEEEDDDAIFRLGNIYFNGLPQIGIKQDFRMALELYLKVEDENDMVQNDLGVIYANGLGVEQNYKKAVYWYSQAAEKQNKEAISNLANCYLLGRGVEQDDRKAAEYHSKAASLGNPASQNLLGQMYLKGKGMEQNYTKAIYWLRKACENEVLHAFAPLGDCYRKGLGVEMDEKKAFELYQKGAQMGDLCSKLSMAECLIEGWGTRCDIKQATQILQAVCNDEEEYRENPIPVISHEDKSGHFFMEDPLDELNLKHYAKAYYLLGKLYYADKGNGGANPSKAIAMLRMADKLGYEGEELSPEKVIDKIVEETEKEDVQDATDCHVVVREENDGRERYKVVLHHADGTESVVKFKGRNKFIYILALLIAKEGRSVCGLTTAHFSYMREDLKDIANHLQVRVDTNSYSEWIDEFIYANKGEIYGRSVEEQKEHEYEEYYSLFPYRYSNAFSGANRAIKACCKSDDEFETFKLRSTGGKNAITTMSLGFSQIKLPDSLMDYLDSLPTQKDLENHKILKAKWMRINDKDRKE